MIDSYFTLRALVAEWTPDLVGTTVGDAFSQARDELTLAFAHRTGDPERREWMLRCRVQRPLVFVFRTPGYSKKRRNVATLFARAFDRRVEGVRLAHLDRMLYLDLAGGWRIQFQLFGARANAFLVDAQGTVVEAFRQSAKLEGTPAPEPRPAPMPETQADFLDRWRPNRNSTRQAVQSAVPLFGRLLARETIRRADVTTDDPAACSDDEKRRLWQSAEVLRSELSAPEPRIYGNGPFPDAFSLVPLTHRDGEPMETFDSVDDAVSVFVKRKLAEAHFHRLYDPLREKLSEAAASLAHGAERMMEELSSESRAGRYERWGHLLMAQQDEAEAQMEAAVRAAGGEAPDEVEVTLPDLFAEGKPVTIPLDPSRDAVANAEGYYARARRTRRSREEAEARLDRALEEAETAQRLLDEIEAIDTLDAVKRFRKKKEDKLAPFLGQKDETIDRFPFRRFRLGKGFEVWVGRNARQNDELTFHTAQKYDLWMHARGVPGSHVVLHRPNRDAEPTKQQLYTAAGIAAHYSKARGSGLVPVMVAERKYVRSPKGSAPGAVTVEREDVLLVEPGLPQGSADD